MFQKKFFVPLAFLMLILLFNNTFATYTATCSYFYDSPSWRSGSALTNSNNADVSGTSDCSSNPAYTTSCSSGGQIICASELFLEDDLSLCRTFDDGGYWRAHSTLNDVWCYARSHCSQGTCTRCGWGYYGSMALPYNFGQVTMLYCDSPPRITGTFPNLTMQQGETVTMPAPSSLDSYASDFVFDQTTQSVITGASESSQLEWHCQIETGVGTGVYEDCENPSPTSPIIVNWDEDERIPFYTAAPGFVGSIRVRWSVCDNRDNVLRVAGEPRYSRCSGDVEMPNGVFDPSLVSWIEQTINVGVSTPNDIWGISSFALAPKTPQLSDTTVSYTFGVTNYSSEAISGDYTYNVVDQRTGDTIVGKSGVGNTGDILANSSVSIGPIIVDISDLEEGRGYFVEVILSSTPTGVSGPITDLVLENNYSQDEFTVVKGFRQTTIPDSNPLIVMLVALVVFGIVFIQRRHVKRN